ncbi:MAG TPA: glycoside hydrolase family 1 protein [Patescibacteria group bacterium]|nr:glycoside hydrolase family 1 protein [Patescibacteria group bacterium]
MTETNANIPLPPGFLLGAATSAHQVEGDNINSDWWAAEQKGLVPKSGLACDHYHKYEEDFEIAHGLGLNAFRISIEWARIEPAEGQFETREVEHYRKVLQAMKKQGLKRMVTLWHFSLPAWVAEKGGFENPQIIEAFARYAWFVANNLGDEIDLWCTINEPEVYVGQSYNQGKWPPFKSNYILLLRVLSHLAAAHKKAYDAIKQVLPKAQVGLAKNNMYYEPYHKGSPFDRALVWISKQISNHYFLDRINNKLDFIGLNYYFYKLMKLSFPGGFVDLNKNFVNQPGGPLENQKSDMGWRTFPEGIYHVLRDLKKYRKPIYITENGIANARDDMRSEFILEHLRWTAKAISEGSDVRGYFYWSLIDNYEWADGYGPLFGLVEVNRETLERKVRRSANVFHELLNQKEVVKN